MRAPACLNADDAVRRQRFVRHEKFCVLFRIDIVGDDGNLIAIAQSAAKCERKCSLAGADRTSDTNAQRRLRRHSASSMASGPKEPAVLCLVPATGDRKTGREIAEIVVPE